MLNQMTFKRESLILKAYQLDTFSLSCDRNEWTHIGLAPCLGRTRFRERE